MLEISIINFKEFINLQETHYSDVYPKTFEEFRKKYNKSKNDNTLFVQFTNYASTDVEKAPYKNPDHKDPIGIYGYPLKYVIDHPADIRYGRSSKYLRIIRNTSPNTTLHLQHMEEWEAKSLLVKCGVVSYRDEATDLLIKAQKVFKFPRNSAKTARQFFANIQFDLKNKDGDSYVQRSGQEQTNILLKGKMTALLDLATNNNTAVINSAEPHQIVFLSRGGFKIEEIFTLREEESSHLMKSNDGNIVIAQKLAAQVFKNINDSIVAQTEDKKTLTRNMGTFVFFSKNGNQLEIKYNVVVPKDWSFGTTNKFKDLKFATRYYPTLAINGEKGEVSERYDVGDKIEYIADDFAKKYNSQASIPDFSKNTLQKYKDKTQIIEKERKETYWKKEEEKIKKEEMEFRLHALNPALLKAGMKQIEESDETMYQKLFTYLLRELYGISRELNITKINEESLKKLWEKANITLPILLRKNNKNVKQQEIDYLKNIFNHFAIDGQLEMNPYMMLRHFNQKN